jgi:hypothetical protein
MQEDEHVEPQDGSRNNSPKSGSGDEGVAAFDWGTGHEACYWNDKKYSDGATVCDAHIRHKCWNGKWVEIGQC